MKAVTTLMGIILLIGICVSIYKGFNGLKKEASSKELQGMLTQVFIESKSYYVDNGTYPKTLADINYQPNCKWITLKFRGTDEGFKASATVKASGETLSIDQSPNSTPCQGQDHYP